MSEIQAILQWVDFQLFLTNHHGHAYLDFFPHLFGVVARLVARDVSNCKQSMKERFLELLWKYFSNRCEK